MVKSNYEDMNYGELEAEKGKIEGQIAGLKTTARELARLMESKQGEQKLQKIADKLSLEEKAQLKDKL